MKQFRIWNLYHGTIYVFLSAEHQEFLNQATCMDVIKINVTE